MLVFLFVLFYSCHVPRCWQLLQLRCFSYLSCWEALSFGTEWTVKRSQRRHVLFPTCGAVVFIQLHKRSTIQSFSALHCLLQQTHWFSFSSPPSLSSLRLKWPQIPSTGSVRASVSMTTQHYRRQSEEQAQCAVFTSWTLGLQARPMSESTGGGKMISFFFIVQFKIFVH